MFTIVSVFAIIRFIDIVRFLYNTTVLTDKEGYLALISISFLLLVINSSVNPIIYGIYSKKYRTIFMRLIKWERKTSAESPFQEAIFYTENLSTLPASGQ